MPMRRPDNRSVCCVMRSAGRLPPPCLAPVPQLGAGPMGQPLAGTVRVCRAGLCVPGSLQQLARFTSSCRASGRAEAAALCRSEAPPVLLQLCRLAWPPCDGSPSAAIPAWLRSEPCLAPLELRRWPQRLHCERPALASPPLPRTAPGSPVSSCSELRRFCASAWGQGVSVILYARCAARRSAASPTLSFRAAALAGQACAQAPRKPQAGQGPEGLSAPRNASTGACAGCTYPRLPPHAPGGTLPPGRGCPLNTPRRASIAL